jgi:hypothetical protein
MKQEKEVGYYDPSPKKETLKQVAEKFAKGVDGVIIKETRIMVEGKEYPKKEGAYLCRMDNAYVKMCYWSGEEWLDMWKPTLEGSVNNWMEIPKDL